MGNFIESGKKINCYSFFYCSTCFCELILEALSRGPVDSRHFVLSTFCAVWREKLPTAELCTTSTSNWDHLTAHTEFGPRLLNWVDQVLVQILRLFRQKRWARCCLHTDGFVRTGPACESRQEALMIPPSPTAAGTIFQPPHPTWGFSSAPLHNCSQVSNLCYNFQS